MSIISCKDMQDMIKKVAYIYAQNTIDQNRQEK